MRETPQRIIYKSKNWKDFEKKISKLNEKDRGTVFEWLCVFYLQIHPVYKAVYKRVLHSTEFLKENEIKKKLGLIHDEQGTDIIGETFDGKIDIVQCKYKDNASKNITAEDLNSSIRIASGREAKKWVDTILICSNLKGFTKNKVLDELDIQFRTLSSGDFQKIDDEDFKNIKLIINKKTLKFKKNKIRPHQDNAVQKAIKHFKTERRGQLIHACGTGKTLTSYFLFEKFNCKLTLYLVPSLQLINQTLTEWCKESLARNKLISPIVICSDKSNENISEHNPQLWLQELGIKVSNNFGELNQFVNSRRKNKVIFCTYQSGKILSDHFKNIKKDIDLAFFDEAHNTTSSKSKIFGHLLEDKNINIKKRLFMTATPKKLVGHDDRFYSMEDEKIYGKLIDEITFKTAIEELKLLNDYEVVTQIVKDQNIKDLLRKNPFVIDKKKLPKEVELKLISGAVTLKKTFKEKNIKNVVSFHGRVNRAKAFKDGINNIHPEIQLNAYHVHGKQSGSIRKDILSDFANNPPSIITNAQCLSEGVDVPSIDAVIFVDPKQSKVDITQAIGRALRKGSKSKGKSYIIVPVIIDKKDSDSIEEAYQQILMVLRSMSEHDGRVVEYFKLIAENKKPKYKLIDVNSEYLPKEFSLDDFIKNLSTKAWSRFSKLGRRPFDQARIWARDLGINSSGWRTFLKSGKKPVDIPSDPPRAYSKEWLGWPDFLGNPSVIEDTNRVIKEIKIFAKGKINPFPPDRYILPDGFELGARVRGILLSKKKGVLPKWREDKIKKELIDKGLFDWIGRDEFMWCKSFNAYKKYLVEGNPKIPKKNTIFDGLNIDTWAQNQKLKYKKKIGKKIDREIGDLTEDQFIKLKSINFQYEDTYEINWKKNFIQVKNIIIKNKGKIPEEAQSLKRWVSSQRTFFKDNKLEKDKIKKLEEIPYWSWNPFGDIFEKNINQLEEYVNLTKDTNPSQDQFHKGWKLGGFLTKIREKYRKGSLEKKYIERIKKLKIKLKPSKIIGTAYYYD